MQHNLAVRPLKRRGYSKAFPIVLSQISLDSILALFGTKISALRHKMPETGTLLRMILL